jgi:hypothetical protein
MSELQYTTINEICPAAVDRPSTEFRPYGIPADFFYFHTSVRIGIKISRNYSECRKEDFRGIPWYFVNGLPDFSASQDWFLSVRSDFDILWMISHTTSSMYKNDE